MAISYTETDTDTSCVIDSTHRYCASGSLTMSGATGAKRVASNGGTAGSTQVSPQAISSLDTAMMFEITPADGTSWDSGTWTVRFNVTSSNMNLTCTSVFICQVNSSCTNISTIGSATPLSISLGSTGVKSQTVSGSAITPSAGDKVLVIIVIGNGAMSTQSVGITPDQNIDSPFTLITQSLVWDSAAPMRPHLVRKVRDFFLGGLPPKLARLRMMQNAAGIYLPSNDPQFARAA